MMRRFDLGELGRPDSLRVVVREPAEAPDMPASVPTPRGAKAPVRPLREWREVLRDHGGIKDPWGTLHPVDLSPWDGADPDTPLVVAFVTTRA